MAIDSFGAWPSGINGRPSPGPLSQRRQRHLLGALLAAALLVELLRHGLGGGAVPVPPLLALKPALAAPLSLRALAPIDLPELADAPAAHASSLAVLPDGSGLMAAWFVGERESAPDVHIVSATFDAATATWSAPQTLIDRAALGRALGFGVRRIGNPVLWFDARGQLHLFVVATGPGGWAAARVVHVRGLASARTAIDAPGAAPTRLEASVLPLSPLWGISLMARGSPARTVGGGALLPLHFELGRDVPMLLELSPDGAPLQASRVTNRIESRQLSLVATGPQQLLAYMRDDAEPQGYVQRARSDDGGRHWRDLPPLGLYNPDSALDSLRLPDGSLVLALNPDRHDRNRLVLMRSFDGGSQWRQEAVLDDEPNTSLLGPARYRGMTEYSYPTLALQGNELHVSYTLHRRQIRHRRFALESGTP